MADLIFVVCIIRGSDLSVSINCIFLILKAYFSDVVAMADLIFVVCIIWLSRVHPEKWLHFPFQTFSTLLQHCSQDYKKVLRQQSRKTLIIHSYCICLHKSIRKNIGSKFLEKIPRNCNLPQKMQKSTYLLHEICNIVVTYPGEGERRAKASRFYIVREKW